MNGEPLKSITMSVPMSTTAPPSRPDSAASADPSDAKEAVAAALRGLRYGTIEVVVHDGRVVQVSRTEKFRVDARKLDGEGAR